jgi:hypothetical protein
MENQRKIFKILNHYRRFYLSDINVRENRNLTPAIVAGAQIAIRKPFFRAWSYSIPAVALKDEEVFVAFWPTILLAGPQSDRLPQFWDGGGNFLSNLRPGANHTLCGYADLSFTVLLSERLLAELQPHLENPAQSPAEREADVQRQRQAILESIPEYDGPPADAKTAAQIEALLAEIRGQTKRNPPPDISREQVLAVFHQRYRQSLVRWFKITDSLPADAGLYDYDGPTNCWFVQFCFTYDDQLLSPSRLIAVSKSTGEIVYDDSANDEG